MRKLAVSLVVLLSACGGGGGGADSQPQQAAPPPCVSVVKVQLFGDSTMWGYDGAAADGSRAAIYPELALLQEAEAKLGPGKLQVETRAVTGTIAERVVLGIDGLNAPWPGSVNGHIAVVSYGINDKFAGVTPESYKASMRKLAVAPAKVVFATPLPMWHASFPGGFSNSFAPEMREVAAELSIPLADESAYAMAIPTWNGTDAPDGVHPNAAGYQKLVKDVLAPVVLPLAQAMLCR
jgi:lysophospholipase L1-like esterase